MKSEISCKSALLVNSVVEFTVFSQLAFCCCFLTISTINTNRPFPSSKKSRFQNEAKCETFVVKKSFICIIIKNHFHINGFALSLALKVRFFGTRKWPIRFDIFALKVIVLGANTK